ncbi:C-type lectin domain family 5 member A-like isoform X2 [Rissa tridactyla]|uniref:C-type lectin domain family 5 member A-like isoform X2 n=1 Tax=Rissa tridactyla TaxID=75485 RepID=UPI0023BA56CA|nr:C-type lectin domain family 5 member A-like isoform X2 [Rissa tridactyla]
MSENRIYADLNVTEPTRPRLQKVTDVQGSTYAEVKVQSLDTNAPASYTSSGKSCSPRTRVAVFVAVIILLLVLAVCRILMCCPTASSPADSKPFSNNSKVALGCPRNWEKHGEKCYFFSQIQEIKDWNASRKECTDMNSDLVVIDTKDELVYLMFQSENYYYFLGLTYSENKKKWKWINNMEHSTDMFNIEGDFTDYFCTVIGHEKVETASCDGSSTTQNMCEKAANLLEEQKEN